MELTKKQIDHIANLARLELTDKEKSLYGSQLSDVLGYFGQLDEVNTDGIEPTAQVTGLASVLRQDEVVDWDISEKHAALKQAPESEEGQVKVKRVIN